MILKYFSVDNCLDKENILYCDGIEFICSFIKIFDYVDDCDLDLKIFCRNNDGKYYYIVCKIDYSELIKKVYEYKFNEKYNESGKKYLNNDDINRYLKNVDVVELLRFDLKDFFINEISKEEYFINKNFSKNN
jgi:hypothetical protein